MSWLSELWEFMRYSLSEVDGTPFGKANGT